MLLNNDLWWKGLPFRLTSAEVWPDLPTSLDTSESDKELVKTPVTIVHSLVSASQSVQSTGISKVMELTRYSSLSKLLRVTAIVLKFIDTCKKLVNTPSKELSAVDIARAEAV